MYPVRYSIIEITIVATINKNGRVTFMLANAITIEEIHTHK